jgi:hypothetical protein
LHARDSSELSKGGSAISFGTSAQSSMKDLPSWLSAFAAMIALGISVWATLKATAGDKRRDRLESHGIAVAIYPEVLKLPTIIQNARDALARLKERDCYLAGQSISAHLQFASRIEIPPMLDRNIDRLFMLGDVAGPACLQLVNILLQHNTLVDDIAARIAVLNAGQWTEGIGHLERHLTLLDGVVAKCKHEVQPLHDAVEG